VLALIRVYVEGVGLRGEGLDSWGTAIRVLNGKLPYVPTPVNLPVLTLLPANERRRMVATVKLALSVGVEAFANAHREPSETATVFASSGGDGETIHEILQSLAAEQIDVSPTRFHNSVHNAPSGYWSIATKSLEPTMSLCCHDASFAAGLLEAAAQATVDQRAVALIAYDLPYPEPLNACRTIGSSFAVGFVFSPVPSSASFSSLNISLRRGNERSSTMTEPRLEALRFGNPAARSLPLLETLARDAATTLVLEHVLGNSVSISTLPLRQPSHDQ
jgi:hypothetical protein